MDLGGNGTLPAAWRSENMVPSPRATRATTFFSEAVCSPSWCRKFVENDEIFEDFSKPQITGLDKGKIYRKPWFLPSNIGLSCNFSHNPILWTNTKSDWNLQSNLKDRWSNLTHELRFELVLSSPRSHWPAQAWESRSNLRVNSVWNNLICSLILHHPAT